MRDRNPFESKQARANSCYGKPGKIFLALPFDSDKPAPLLAQFVHKRFRCTIRQSEYPCVGAKSAIQRRCYRFGLYSEMGSAGATAGLCHDLYAFVLEQPRIGGEFTTFVACFSSPLQTDEEEFEDLLWKQLQRLHDKDAVFHAWDKTVSADPSSPAFSFSFAKRAYFVVGMHPGSSREARRFMLPTLVFNAHYQFEDLRRLGKFKSMQHAIRAREMAWEGSINPNLTDYGEQSEARQYSGRAVEADWHCPLRVHRTAK